MANPIDSYKKAEQHVINNHAHAGSDRGLFMFMLDKIKKLEETVDQLQESATKPTAKKHD